MMKKQETLLSIFINPKHYLNVSFSLFHGINQLIELTGLLINV